MSNDGNMEKIRDKLNEIADITDLCNKNLLIVSQLMDDMIMDFYREKSGKRKRRKKQSKVKFAAYDRNAATKPTV